MFDDTDETQTPEPRCCYLCATPERRMTRMIVCPDCGNKRCPRATNHRLDCTHSNETNQPGSRYADDWQGP